MEYLLFIILILLALVYTIADWQIGGYIMFDWKGYIANVMRNVVVASSFIGAVAALMEGYVMAGVLFIIVYSITITDEEWYYTPDDDDDGDNNDTEKKE